MEPVITSRTNARVKRLRAASKGPRRAADGLVAVEGLTLVQELLRSSISPEAIFVREDSLFLLRDVRTLSDVFPLSSDVYASAVGVESAQGIAATFTPPGREITLSPGHLLLVLESLQDPGNIGTLIRSAEAFGADAVVLTPGTADAWNTKAIRASAGSVFRIPLLMHSIEDLHAAGIPLAVAVARDGAVPNEASLRQGAIVIGNEGNGVSQQTLALASTRITIPMPGHVESLNAAIAGSLLLYEASRQRSRL